MGAVDFALLRGLFFLLWIGYESPSHQLLTYLSPSAIQPPNEESIDFIAQWAITIIIVRGLIYPSHVLGFFVDNRVSIMSIRWFYALGSRPSYLTTVLTLLTIVPLSIGQFFVLPLTYHVSTQCVQYASRHLVSMRSEEG
jgi:hypothetical protein